MSENRNWSNLGEQILDSVTEALNTGDFSGVNDLLSETVSGVLQEARSQAKKEKERQKEKVQRQYDDWRQREVPQGESWQERRERSVREAQQLQAVRTPAQIVKDMRAIVKNKKVGSVSSVFYLTFGIIGMGLAAFNLVAGIAALIVSGSGLGAAVFGAVMALLSLFLLDRGTRQRARLSRSDVYMRVCGYKMYGMLEEMAKQTGKTLRFVRRDLRKMLKLGFFPEGHLDERETCLMLNDTVYRQYEETASAYRQTEEEARRLEEAAKAPKTLAEQVAEEQRAREAELDTMVAEGRDYIRRLRNLNDNIPGEPISGKLFQLENLLNEIFDCVKEHPEQMHRMHKLMDYYLPTTLKLVEAYKEFSEVSVPGEDILSAMAEIEKTLDAINLAFRELLNALFQDAALDVTTDAQVLQTMLAREGLTREFDPVTVSGGQTPAAKQMPMEGQE